MRIRFLFISIILTVFSFELWADGLKDQKIKSDQLACILLLANRSIYDAVDIKTSLAEYESEYLSAVAGVKYWRQYLPHIMEQKIKDSKIILFSDNHRMMESQKYTIELMSLLRESNDKPLTLVIEWIPIEFQGVIDDYLAGHMNVEEVRAKVGYDRHWGFPWSNYKKILTSAKKLKVRILAGEHKIRTDFRDVDSVVAKRVLEDKINNPDMRYLIVYGTYHVLGEGHIRDQLVGLNLTPDVTLTDVADDVYWRAMERYSDFSYLRFKENTFFVNLYSPLNRNQKGWEYYRWLFGPDLIDVEDLIFLSETDLGTD